MHKRIKGRLPDGTHYHSLDPGPFAWVHATLVHSIIKVATRFGTRPTERERRDRLSGLARDRRAHRRPPADLPETHHEFVAYVRHMEHEALHPTVAVKTVLRTWRHRSRLRSRTSARGPGAWRAGPRRARCA